MANHAIVTIEKVNRDGVELVNVQHTADMDNGSVVHLGDFVTGEGELRQVSVPTSASILADPLFLVHSPEIQGDMYLPYSTLKDFYNPANKPARGYRLPVGAQFKITTDGFDGTAAKNSYLIPQAGSVRLKVAADLNAGTRFAAKIIATGETLGYTGTGFQKKDAILVEIIKN
jgi:hypothetical protein